MKPKQKKLTLREQEIIDCLKLGLSNAEMADKLCVSIGAIKSRFSSLNAKLGTRDSRAIMAWMIQQERIKNETDAEAIYSILLHAELPGGSSR